jgi:hypothetical protein
VTLFGSRGMGVKFAVVPVWDEHEGRVETGWFGREREGGY